MGAVISSVFTWVKDSQALSTTPDPGTGLSELDRHLIKSSWAMASDQKVIKENGIELFVRLFRAYPYMQDSFENFRGVPLDKLPTHPKMRAHALTVMYAIGNYVMNLDDAETLVGLVEKIAESHVARGVASKEFERLNEMFMPLLRSFLLENCTPEVESAWTKLLQAQLAIVKKVEAAAAAQ